MPLNTAGSQPSAGDDPLSNAIQAEQRANPTAVSVNAPTKFGKLLSLVQPMLEGAAVGGFSGKGHPGGGFGAAQEFYDKQRDEKLRRDMLQRTLTNDTFRNALEAARTQREIDRPNFSRVAFTNANGPNGPVLLHTNPDTGQPEEVQGYSPFEKNENNVTPHMTDQGLMGISKTGEAAPITIPGAPQTVATPTGSKGTVPGNKFSGAAASPSVTRQVPGAPIPLGPPKKPNERPDSPDLQDFDYLTRSVEDGGMGLTPDQAHARMKAQGRKGEDNGELTGQKYNKERQKIQGRLDVDLKGSETTRAKAIAALNKDVTISDEEKAAKLQEIEGDNADRKQQIHQKYADEADAEGVNLGEVPNYRSQLGGVNNGENNGAPTGAPTQAAAEKPAKVASTNDILAYAQKNNISSVEARKRFTAKGYAIQPVVPTRSPSRK